MLRSAGGPATRHMEFTPRPHHDPFLAQVQEVMEAAINLAEEEREAGLADEIGKEDGELKWYWVMNEKKHKKEREEMLAEDEI